LQNRERRRHARRAQPTLPQLSDEELEQLKQGLQVRKQERSGAQGSGYVVCDVNAPASLILKCLEAFEDYPGMIPVVRKAEIRSRSKAGGMANARCSYRISKFWLGIDVVHSVDHDAGLVHFDLDDEVPRLVPPVLQQASGFWYVERSPDGPPGTSRVWLCVTGLRASNLLPHCIVDYAAERALRRATCWLRPVLEERWRQMQNQPPSDLGGHKAPPSGDLQVPRPWPVSARRLSALA